MEGTRHEKAILIILAYVIGITTGFIAFGVNKLSEGHDTQTSMHLQSDHIQKSSPQVSKISSVSVGEDGLFALTNGYKRILSANKNTISASVLSSLGTEGYFYRIIDAQISPDGQFLYYCEQLSENASTCDSYIYALNNDSIYSVKVDDAAYTPAIEPYDASWNKDGLLRVNNAIAAATSSPWFLYTKNLSIAN